MFRRQPRTRLNCIQVGRVLQQYLDDIADPNIAPLLAAHLEDCRRCGMKANEYRAIKRSLARATPPDDPALQRLRAFGEHLASHGPPPEPVGGGSAATAPDDDHPPEA
jgi:hypothetical protein